MAGGAAIATAPDGRVVLVDGALPAERVVLADPVVRRRMITAEVGAVIESSPHRVEPPCPAVAVGCGGCDLQYADAGQLPAMKVGIVVDALRHLGGVPDAAVELAPALAPWGFRTSVRAVADRDGRLGFRRRRSHDVVVTSHCLVVHPLVDEILVEGRFPAQTEVAVRASAATGERLVVLDGSPADVVVPDDVAVLGRGSGRGQPWITERAAERWWRVSGTSFFQARPDGAGMLASEVAAAVGMAVDAGAAVAGTLVDAYAGVGLLAGVVRDAGWAGPLVAVERHGPATADAAVNLADDGVSIVTEPVESWRPVAAEVVIADPARSGLGATAVDVVVGTGARAVVLVSCDAAALGRDVGLLVACGYRHHRSVLVDMFPHTHHVEVVTLLTAGGR